MSKMSTAQTVTYRRTATLLGDQNGQWLCNSGDNTSSMGPDTNSWYYQMNRANPLVADFASSVTSGFLVPGNDYHVFKLAPGPSSLLSVTLYNCSAGPSVPVFAGGNSFAVKSGYYWACLLYTSPSPRDRTRSRMPSSA